MFVKVRRIFTVGAVLFLLLLFLLPSLYLKQQCRLLNELCDRVVSTRDKAAYDELRERYSERVTSRLFGEFSPLLFGGRDIREQKLRRRYAK